MLASSGSNALGCQHYGTLFSCCINSRLEVVQEAQASTSAHAADRAAQDSHMSALQVSHHAPVLSLLQQKTC